VSRVGNPRAPADCQSAKQQITNLYPPNRRGSRRLRQVLTACNSAPPDWTTYAAAHGGAAAPTGASFLRGFDG